jgi:Putative Flp pilus-assembly TadE/G-like
VNYLLWRDVRSCPMKPRLRERGQALILIALAAVGLFGFSALAIDGSRVFSDRRHAQNTADTAALAAALAKIRGESFTLAGEDRAKSNGYMTDADSKVEVNLCNDPAITTPCQGIPTTGDMNAINPANYIQVKITTTIPATFGRIVGRSEFTSILTSIAYAGPVEPQPLVNGNALAAMNRDEMDAIFGGGTMSLRVNNSGIFSNSRYTDAGCQHGSMRTQGTGTYQVATSIQVAGSFCQGGVSTIIGPVQQTSSIDYPPLITIPIPNLSCGGATGSTSEAVVNGIRTITYHPGNFGNIILNSTDPVNFDPGTYCFSGGVSFNGPKIIANSVKFLVTGGDFKINGSKFTCNDVLIHIKGGNGIDFGGTSNIFCNNVTFIVSTGGVTWNGAIENRMYAPTGGDYKGVLLYMPFPNDKPIKINGNSTNQLTGSIIGVASPITVTGNDWTTGLHSQIIGNTVNLNGNGTMVINYDPAEQYVQIDPSAIKLTK